jgi:hypothetical protein
VIHVNLDRKRIAKRQAELIREMEPTVTMIPRHALIQPELAASGQLVRYKPRQIVPAWAAHGKVVRPVAIPIHVVLREPAHAVSVKLAPSPLKQDAVVRI